MSCPQPLEVWLRGPLPDVPPLLQPVAHALLQAREELTAALHDFPPALLNERPGRRGLRRLSPPAPGRRARPPADLRPPGNPDRSQFAAFHAEVPPLAIADDAVRQLVQAFSNAGRSALQQLQQHRRSHAWPKCAAWAGRRCRPPLIGMLVHAAEHTTRHLGQLLVTAKWVQSPS